MIRGEWQEKLLRVLGWGLLEQREGQAPPLQVLLGFHGLVEAVGLIVDGGEGAEGDFSGVALD